MLVRVEVNMPDAQALMKKLGVDRAGRVQQFATNEVMARIRKYMPWDTGYTANTLTYQTQPAEFVTAAPYARWLYNGVTASGRPINYTKRVNPLAGAHWDRTLIAAEGEAIRKAIQGYVDKVKVKA